MFNSEYMMNSVSEYSESSPINSDYIIPLDFEDVLKLPDSHTWTPPCPGHPINNNDPITHEAIIPTIDLGHPHALALIRQASEKWGMFQVINHGIPIDFLHEVELQTRRLFELPASRKLLAVRSTDGMTGYGLARFSTFFTKKMWYEGFTIIESPVQHACQLWPEDHTKFSDVIMKWQKEMKGLSERIIGLLFMSLGLSQEDVEWFKPNSTGNKPPQSLLQLNSYPACPDPDHAMGLAPHSDSSLLTVLYPSNTSGLQVLGEEGGWVPVHPLPGALVVILGDMMQVISNGRIKSALHRAVVNKTHHRISIAYFYGPPKDVKIGPSMKMIDLDHPILYRPVTWKEYLDGKGTHFYGALELIKQDAVGSSYSK